MKTFTGWRAVGRAMRWARQQKGVRYDVTEIGRVVDTRWRFIDSTVVVQCFPGFEMTNVSIRVNGARYQQHDTSVVRALRVLAALDLIPADLAEVDAEQCCPNCAPSYDCERGQYVAEATDE